MHCWFCESPLRRSSAGLYCPVAACPACKDGRADAPLDGPETEYMRRMREAGTLTAAIAAAGFGPRDRRALPWLP